MGKTKVADKSSKKDKKSELSSVKDGRVTKPAQTPKAKSKDIAKSAATSVKKEKKKSKKAKTPTPEPESSSESESESEDDDEDSSASSSEEEKVVKKTISTAAKDESDSSDSSSDDSESDSDEEKPAAKANGVKVNGASKAASDSDSSDSSDSESDADEEKKAKADSSDESESDSDSNADSSDSDDSESDEEEAPSKKRKAEEVAEPAVKKTKTEEPAAGSGIANLFVGSLSWNVDEDWLRREFEHFGEIVGCRVITDRDSGRSKGFGYVEFAKPADAAKAHAEMNGYQLDGRALNVDFSTPRQKPENKANDRANKYGDKRSAPANTLFLGNLSFDCTNEGIQQIFADYGNITRVSLPTDRDTGSLKGFGYVDFTTTEEATAALEALNGQEVEGRAIRIDYAAPRADNGGAGGRGGFGGGRGGGRGGFGGRGGGRGGRGGGRGGRGGFTTNRGGFGDFQGQKKSFD